MIFVTGEIIPSDDAEFPVRVVFKRGDEVLAEWLAKNQEDAEIQIVEALHDMTEDAPEGSAPAA
jgi:dihydrodipicolinate reductase